MSVTKDQVVDFLSNLTVREQVRTGVMLELLMNEQMSSMERARRGNG